MCNMMQYDTIVLSVLKSSVRQLSLPNVIKKLKYIEETKAGKASEQ